MAVVLGGSGTAALAAPKPKTPKPVFTSTPTAISTSRSATFTWTAATSTSYTCSLDGSAAAACTSPQSLSGLTDRRHTFVLKATVAGGRAASTTYSWLVDATPPAAPTVAPLPTPTSSTSASVSWTDPDTSVVGFSCALDGAPAAPCTSPRPLSGLAEGSHTIVVTARDSAGNTASASRTWVVDLTAPNVPVVVPPASPSGSSSASIAFALEEGSTFTCALDGAPVLPCASPQAVNGLAEGAHTFTVTPTDQAGNPGSPGSASWVVDLTAPATPQLVTGPAALTNVTDLNAVFTELDQTTVGFTCELDAVTEPCTSPYVKAGPLSEAAHSLKVRALDAAGNQSAPLTVSWTVDATAPGPAEFVSGPGSPTSATTASFDFVETDADTVSLVCTLDTVVQATCTPGAAFTDLAEGSHAFSVVAVDDVPNSSSPVTWSWVVDLTGPVAPTAGGSTALGVVKAVPALTFGSADAGVASYSCAIDGAAPVSCASGVAPVVTDGAHSVVVRSVDAAGNPSAAGLTFTFTLDTVAPVAASAAPTSLLAPTVVSFTENVTGVVGKATLRVTGGVGVATTATCYSVGGAAVPCTGAVRHIALAPKTGYVPGQRYTVTVAAGALDAAGNASALKALGFRAGRVVHESLPALSQAWTPVVTSAAYGGKYVVSDLIGSSASYAFTGTSVTWYTVRGRTMGTAKVYVDGVYKGVVNNYATAAQYRVPRTLSGLSNAKHTLKIVATGLKGSSGGLGTRVAVDAVKVGTTLTTNPVVSTRWASRSAAAAQGGGYVLGDLAGSTAALTFRGTSIRWTTVTGTTMGKARVYIDGVLKGTYDNWSSSTKHGVSRTWALTDKVHTIRIVVLGAHRPGGKGNNVAVDALTVG